MKPVVRYRAGDASRWDDVPVLAYKAEGDHFRDITRQVLFGPEAGVACELRYFEIGPDGHSTLERHEHTHAVLILRGCGRVLVGSEIFEVAPHDLVRVAPLTWHQFRAEPASPLGFLCLVDAERDRPQRPGEAELAELRADPRIAGFVRV
jgi:quercetin dioxygenase-like cupin family protein